MKAFTFAEVENVFEIGRIIQALISKGHIKYYESKEAFLDALSWAIEFEREHKETEDYYFDIDMFIQKKLKEKGTM